MTTRPGTDGAHTDAAPTDLTDAAAPPAPGRDPLLRMLALGR
ncbi:MAG: hypothetical protein QOK35_457, partial [Pseudonocardiales bacterium]|nr:hypothetical protein [Pseudonocardiales bacterium]